ncbi:MAG: hypothetical protein EZS28_007734 [Streblomastix strix]|uniref:Leucine-rich repeat-containing protein 23 n=1 Tax=Streblomastix strix TaxID=222440 RepID=A0A5J4WP48_9EUKA|nr:MAG: hypothetical protein EZS28_007734 [Streblomastix strix]
MQQPPKVIKDESGIPLTADAVAIYLTHLEPVGNGNEFAFTELNMHSLKLEDISIIKNYANLRHINFSDNRITDISPLSDTSLTNILTLDLSKNKITTLEPLTKRTFPFLQLLIVSENRIKQIPQGAFAHPFLKWLNLDGNEIADLGEAIADPEIPIQFLELRSNKLKDCYGLNQNVSELDLAGNLIENIRGLSICANLTRLDLSYNKIKTIEEIKQTICYRYTIKGLKYIHLSMELKYLVTRGNPFEEEVGGAETARTEILIRLPALKKLNGKRVTDEELRAAAEVQEQRDEEEKQKMLAGTQGSEEAEEED